MHAHSERIFSSELTFFLSSLLRCFSLLFNVSYIFLIPDRRSPSTNTSFSLLTTYSGTSKHVNCSVIFTIFWRTVDLGKKRDRLMTNTTIYFWRRIANFLRRAGWRRESRESRVTTNKRNSVWCEIRVWRWNGPIRQCKKSIRIA